MFVESHVTALDRLLADPSIPDEFYYYWNDVVNAVGYTGDGRVAQPFGFRPHRSERAAFPHSAPPEGYPTLARETSRE